MEYLYAVILGAVQGFTEFLPVSSSGHLVLLEHVGIGESSVAFNLLLHLATLLSVAVFYRKRLWEMLKHPFCRTNRNILLASLPTAVSAFFIRLYFNDVRSLPFCFAVTAVLLFLGNKAAVRATVTDAVARKTLSASSALVTGVAQGLACFNGISRSGSTVATMLMLGVDRREAGDFSFLLSIPIIVGSAAVEFLGFDGFSSVNILPALIGMAVAFGCGLAAIKGFLKVLQKGTLLPFSIYTLIMSGVSFLVIF